MKDCAAGQIMGIPDVNAISPGKKNSFPGREGDDLARNRYGGMSLIYLNHVCIGHVKKGTLAATHPVVQNQMPVYKADARKIFQLLEKNAPPYFYRFDGIRKHKKTYRAGLFVLRGRHGGSNPNKMLQIDLSASCGDS